MIFQHVERETPVALPPEVAGTYVEHTDAVPGWPCSGCGYPLPARGRPVGLHRAVSRLLVCRTGGCSVPAALATRLERLEAVQRAANQARHDAAIKELGRTMEPEHIRLVQDWMHEHVGHGRPLALLGESPAATIGRLRPPALVRAAWLMVDEYVRSGSPVSLAPEVARVYLEDQDAYPGQPLRRVRLPAADAGDAPTRWLVRERHVLRGVVPGLRAQH